MGRLRLPQWVRIVGRVVSGLLIFLGLSGLPDDVQQWGSWLSQFDSNAWRWVFVGVGVLSFLGLNFLTKSPEAPAREVVPHSHPDPPRLPMPNIVKDRLIITDAPESKIKEFQRECRVFRTRVRAPGADAYALKVEVDTWLQATHAWFEANLAAYSEVFLRPATSSPGYREGMSTEANNLSNSLSQYLDNLSAIQLSIAGQGAE